MDYELFKEIIDECKAYGPRSFSLHLFGDPLLYPHITDSIRYIKSAHRSNTVLLTTNGILLNRFAKELLEIGTDRIIWSWRKNNFNSDTLRILRKIGIIRILVEETPQEEVKNWSTFPRVEIKHLHNYGGQIDTSKWGLDATIGDRYPCYHLWLAPAIRWNGDITICCNDPHGVELLGRYGQVGMDLASAWNSDRLRGIRDSHMRGEYKRLCKNCNVWKTYPDIFFDVQKKHVAAA